MGHVLDFAAAQERHERLRNEPWVTKADIAKHFACTTRTMERWMNLGMPYSKPYEGGSVRLRKSECDEWFSRR